MDVVGFVLLSPGIVGILYGLSNASKTNGFARPDVYAPLLIGVALLVAFVIHALRRGDHALVDVRLFADRAVASASALLFLSGAALYGAMLLLPLDLQDVRGVDALGAGLLLVPQGIGTFFSRSLAGRLTDALGAKWVTLVGFAIVGAATIPLMTAVFIGLERSDDPTCRTRASSPASPASPSKLAAPSASRSWRSSSTASRPGRYKLRLALRSLRPGVLVVHRLHRPGRRPLLRPARQT